VILFRDQLPKPLILAVLDKTLKDDPWAWDLLANRKMIAERDKP
jgi:hypothetical protein